ncbi:MAG TPA: ABC transporter ATP-binding protein [Dehalococcoidia bacterium]|nr:ABC transporter ATP-binding protein [Dehalococcoidia bacterium]
MDTVWAVETRQLTKVYGDRVVALSGVDLRVRPGVVYGLVGPNGAGKTTLFRILMGLQQPTAGEALVFGEKMHANAADLRRRIGFLATNPRFPRHETAIQYLRFVGEVSGLSRDEREFRVAALLRDFDLMSAAGQRIGTFSTGMTTRLGIAAAFINEPDLLIWDEPTSGLDPVGRRQVIDLIRSMDAKKTLIVSTHVLGDVDRVCHDIGVLYRGQLIYSGPIGEMKRMTHARTVELEVEGEVSRLVSRLAALERPLSPEYEEPFLRLTLSEDLPLAATLSHVLSLAAEEGVAVTSINMLGDQLEEAFLQRLEEDRRHGLQSHWRAGTFRRGGDVS